MKIPGFAQLRVLWRILRSLDRIASALERAYPAPEKKPHSPAIVIESRDETEEEAMAELSVRDGRVPWDVDAPEE